MRFYIMLNLKTLNVDCFMNSRPLCYVEEEFYQPVIILSSVIITPNILLRRTPSHYFEDNIKDGGLYGDEFVDVTRQMKYSNKCRNQLRKNDI